MSRISFSTRRPGTRAARLSRLLLSVSLGLLMCLLVVMASRGSLPAAQAEGPLPGGTPKFFPLSTKTVTPTIAEPGEVLTYTIKLVNTGARPAEGVRLRDVLPTSTTYIASSAGITVANGVLTWEGDVGFDSSVEITFSAKLVDGFDFGRVVNTAVVTDDWMARPLTLTAVTTVTNVPILHIGKSSLPEVPGPNKPLIYALSVTNQGKGAANLPITVTDQLPADTTFLDVGPDGGFSGGTVTWTRSVTLELGQTTVFTFSVTIDDVPSGTVIANEVYQVDGGDEIGLTAGEVYTVTVIDPIFSLSKQTWPDPPGSNREMVYTLTLLNMGSLATDLVITDRVPAGVEYVSGGSLLLPYVIWTWPSLDTGESAEFTYTVYISDVMGVDVVNSDYKVCSAEGVCAPGEVLTSTVHGPTFVAEAMLDPYIKKPGGGGGPVTPTLVVRNIGPGTALSATAVITFGRISVSARDFYVTPTVGQLSDASKCGDKCTLFSWVGDLAYGDAITFTTTEAQSTIGGAEGTHYTATIIITDSFANNVTTAPVTATAIGTVTHFANVIPRKLAPSVIGPGQLLTYTLRVWNSAFTTKDTVALSDVVPVSTTFVRASDGGELLTVSDTQVVSWTLDAMGTGEKVFRTFTVRVDDGLVSGTQIVNREYSVDYEDMLTGTLTSGPPVTTTVQEVGLIHSFKEVTPATALPGENVILTYYLHIVNSSGVPLTGITVDDVLPWEHSTYLRGAVASAGAIVSDIVTIDWTGSVGAFSSEVITLSVWVDPAYKGPVTNTATIAHRDLPTDVVVHAVAYVTDEPVLRITKSASPDPVDKGGTLEYTIRVRNLGKQATGLVITDVVPAGTVITGGVSAPGGQVRWEFPVLKPGESRNFKFEVEVTGDAAKIVNEDYAVKCAEGVSARGEPVSTSVRGAKEVFEIYLPVVLKNHQ